MRLKSFFTFYLIICVFVGKTQDRWQQGVTYAMDIDMNVETNQFAGSQKLEYFNNSPDTLDRVYYHLYFNAFQPGSMMDVRSRAVAVPDRRVKDRIYNLKEDEIGYQKINKFSQDGKKLKYSVEGTVMTVYLNESILPGTSSVFDMKFEAQVPIQIRRSGRDNAEGIRYSMGQWYPKMAEYDRSGWHADQYLGREFYGPWGDFEVKITIDSAYTIGAGGVLQNPEQIGKGYAIAKSKTEKLTYHFKAENVHDFMWAADPDFSHDVINVTNNLQFHYFYQADTLADTWASLETFMIKALPFIEDNLGKYPYPVYSFIQGGDGGMEYPMATLITGHRNLESLVGVAIHEFIHSWYQMMLGTNENYFYWMDEGFTSYASNLSKEFVFDRKSTNPHIRSFKSYFRLVDSGKEEPMTTHADRFKSLRSYQSSAYSKGAITLRQLAGIMGKENFQRGMLRYFNEWKFKHPDDVDFMRVMEKECGLELDWYFNYWIKTTKRIDYGIRNVTAVEKGTSVQLEKIGEMPMPLDVKVILKNGNVRWYHIALSMMLGQKKVSKDHITLSNWPWVNDFYAFEIKDKIENIVSIEIDPDQYTADTNRDNNKYPLKSSTLEIEGVPLKINYLD